MRGIGDKAFFPLDHAVNPAQKAVHGGCQRLDFVGQILVGKRRQIIGTTRFQFFCQSAERRKFAADEINHRTEQNQQSAQPGGEKFLNHVQRDFGTVLHFLADGYDVVFVRGIDPDDAPLLIIHVLVDETAGAGRENKVFAVFVIVKNHFARTVKNGKTDRFVFFVGIVNAADNAVGGFLTVGGKSAPVGRCQLTGKQNLILVEKFVDFLAAFKPRKQPRTNPDQAGNAGKKQQQANSQT